MVKLSFKPYTKEILTNKAYRSCWLEICSKYYGFIQGLIENDKIDIEKFPQIMEYSDYETLLMLLSISDSPILDLISVLK